MELGLLRICLGIQGADRVKRSEAILSGELSERLEGEEAILLAHIGLIEVQHHIGARGATEVYIE